MIALASNCLVFEMASGESVPFSAEMISVELMGGTEKVFDPEFVSNAANAVFYYFKHELRRKTVTVGEFTLALEKVLQGFAPLPETSAPVASPPQVLEADLGRLASEFATGCELFFFPRLRDELRQQLQRTPKLLRFRGLRGCVKHLAGARRWSPRCQSLHDQIVAFLRHCLTAEAAPAGCALLVE